MTEDYNIDKVLKDEFSTNSQIQPQLQYLQDDLRSKASLNLSPIANRFDNKDTGLSEVNQKASFTKESKPSLLIKLTSLLNFCLAI